MARRSSAILWLGLVLALPARGPAAGLPEGARAAGPDARPAPAAPDAATADGGAIMEDHLTTATRVVAEAEAELQSALRNYDEQASHEAGTRLRELKQRRDKIADQLADIRNAQRRQEAAALVRQRSDIQHRMEAIAPAVDKAGAAFDEAPTANRGGELSTLAVQEINLRNKLEAAEAAAKEGQPASATTRPPPRPLAQPAAVEPARPTDY